MALWDDELLKLDREALIERATSYVKKLVASALEEKINFIPRPALRPPGAQVESIFISTCTGCAECVKACPYQAITLLGPAGAQAEATPTIVPTGAPCRLCPEVPCSHVCPSGALIPVAVADVKMGTAVVVESRCFAFQGQECAECVKACPVGTKAIVSERGVPSVLEEGCTGCGVCTFACPARPRAIRIKPR